MPNTELTLENIREETLTELGVSAVEVELVEKDIDKCLKDALRLYNRVRPKRIRAVLTTTSAQKKYRIDNIVPDLLGVVHVEFIRQQNVFGDPFDPFFNDRTGLTVTGDTYGEFDQKLHYIEEARRIGSTEPEWHAQWETIVTDPSTDPPTTEEQYFIYANTSIPVDTGFIATPKFLLTDKSMQTIPEGDVDWILAYVSARAKQILGKIRGKFKGITGPEGENTEIDYDEMKEEGVTEETELKEEINKRRRPLLPVIE